jgi:membrane-associated phospholipid phosphatase
LERRSFLKSFSGAAAVAAGTGIVVSPDASAVEVGPENAQVRRANAFNLRLSQANAQKNLPLPPHPTSPDDTLYPNFIGSFTKALPHNALGEVIPSAYLKLRKALSTGKPSDFDAIPLGGSAKLANPQAAYAYGLEGADSHHLGMLPAPALASAWCAGEMVEVYWRAWTRDIPFINFAGHAAIASAVADLNALSDFRGPKVSGAVTEGTLFRGTTPGDLTGPYVSQFLYQDIPFGATTIPQRYRTTAGGDNHMTSYADWLAVQNGFGAQTAATPEPTPRYIATGRDLAEYVHFDFSYQAFQGAALILLGYGGGALDDANPYKSIANQGAFVTFGGPMILDLVARAGIEALKAAWYQKWLVHRRLRPEAYAGLVHHVVEGNASYPVHPDVLDSAVLPLIQGAYGTSLLPMAFPEGSPTHTAYPAGHATIAGACVTILKAFFKETFAIPAPVQADATGSALIAYGGPLAVGGELNKLASNIAYGRDTGGVHWRTDGSEGLKLGEELAIRLLRDHKVLNKEPFAGFSLTRFDGTTITI